MDGLVADTALVARCGLYCGACRAFKRGNCGGCDAHGEGHWCKVLACCREHDYRSCADCTMDGNLRDCRKLNNMISKLFALVFRSDRFACLEAIRVQGYDDYARQMAENGLQSIKRGL